MLTRDDYRWALELAHHTRDCETLPALWKRVLSLLAERFVADRIVLNLQTVDGDFVAGDFWPDLPAGVDELAVRYQELFHEHPVVGPARRRRQRSGGQEMPVRGGLYQMSDFVTHQGVQHTALFNEVFAPLGGKNQLIWYEAFRPFVYLVVGFFRQRRDFTRRERQLVEAVGGPIAHAARAIDERETLEDALVALSAVPGSGRGKVIVDARGLAVDGDPEAHALLVAAGLARPGEVVMPDEVRRALREAAAGARWAARSSLSFSLHGSSGSLRARAFRRPEGCTLLLLEQEGIRGELSVKLTPRQAEVARWMAEGKTNTEIAMILSLSPRTVEKHIAAVYEILGAENRSAAVRLLAAP